MKQYCRYCIHLSTGNGTWCEEKKKTMEDSAAKRVNKCKSFSFCEIDAFDGTARYKPRQPKNTASQISLFDGGTDHDQL